MSEFSREFLSFVEIARERSIRRAAEKLNVASSALSRQMRILESDLGVQLLLRDVRGVQLTDQGRLVLTQAEAWLDVTSRKTVWLFPEQLWFQFVPVLHRLQGGPAAQG